MKENNRQSPGRRSRLRGAENRYVIQKHQARTLHYDFRLEVEGTLKSWAVPKGPSMNPRDKRLAVRVEDHPVEYVDFEGIIPDGGYGAGTVLVWDTGTYHNLARQGERLVSAARGIDQGHVAVWLDGKKLKGGYALIRMKKGAGENWLLTKMNDEEASAERDPVLREPESVLSGRTIEEIAKGFERKHSKDAG